MSHNLIKGSFGQIIIQIAKCFSDNQCRWALGGSMVLWLHNIVEQPNDIDIIIHHDDYAVAAKTLKAIGDEIQVKSSLQFFSKHFSSYQIQGIHVDLIAMFKIKTNDTVYTYPFDSNSIDRIMPFKNTPIPFCSLEDWYVLYRLMNRRQNDYYKIESHILAQGIKDKDVFTRTLANIDAALRADINHKLSIGNIR